MECFLFSIGITVFRVGIQYRGYMITSNHGLFLGGRILGFKPVSRLCCEFAGGL